MQFIYFLHVDTLTEHLPIMFMIKLITFENLWNNNFSEVLINPENKQFCVNV